MNTYIFHLPMRFVALEPLELLAKREELFCLHPLVRETDKLIYTESSVSGFDECPIQQSLVFGGY